MNRSKFFGLVTAMTALFSLTACIPTEKGIGDTTATMGMIKERFLQTFDGHREVDDFVLRQTIVKNVDAFMKEIPDNRIIGHRVIILDPDNTSKLYATLVVNFIKDEERVMTAEVIDYGIRLKDIR